MPKYSTKEVDGTYVIQIDEGEFEGVHYGYGPIQFLGEDEDGFGRLAFSYDLYSSGRDVNINDEEIAQRLETVLAEILSTIVAENLNRADNEIGNPDTDEPTV